MNHQPKLHHLFFYFLILALCAAFPALFGQGEEGKPITLNFVARKSDGNLATGLTADAIKVVDNGTAEEIRSFEEIDSPSGMRTVMMVYGGLGNEGRRYARQASQDFLNAKLDPNVRIAAFVIDRRLYATEPFTADKGDLEDAIELATSGSFEKFREESRKIKENVDKQALGLGADSQLAQIVSKSLGRAAEMQREEWNYAALDALTILAEEMGRMPGRKVIIFFSQGLVIGDDMFDRFNFLVSAANMSQTSIYTVDCRGLLSNSLLSESQSMLSGAQQASASQLGATGATSAGQVRALENASQSVRMNAQEAIANLSLLTGASILANTNDSRPGMTAIAEELDHYYRLEYVPDGRDYSGQFRQVVFNVDDSDIVLKAPGGYYDLPQTGGQMSSYELPMMTALSSADISDTFGLNTKVFSFGEKDGKIQHTFALEVPLQNFTFVQNEEQALYATHFSLLALVKDQSGEIVEKFSQDYPLSGPLDKLSSLTSGNVVFLRNFYLAPGTYTIEAAAVDQATEATSATRTSQVVPKPDPGAPGLSSVMVIERVSDITDPSKEVDNPLRYQDKKITPNMGDSLVKSPGAQLGIYCVVYPAENLSNDAVLALLFFKDGQPLFQGRPPLPPADEEGRIQVVLNLPMDNLQPGNYEIVGVVQQGSGTVERRTQFQLVQE